MKKLDFKILKEKGNARVGQISLNGIELMTPVFMPVGTKATIKGLLLELLQDPYRIGEDVEFIKMILANSFHLYLRPGVDTIKEAGGLHRFENRPGLILTDSGGFQVFSLGLANKKDIGGNSHSVSMKLKEEGVYFRSPYDGSKHVFTPENVVDLQLGFGSDIMMMLDVCSPISDDKELIKRQMNMTHRRAKRGYEHFMKKYNDNKSTLFPIVQGGTYLDLRQESIDILSEFATDGIAVGGVSVGESKEKIQDVVSFCGSKLPKDKPRYLMGVGTPEDILHAIENGFDMFDCVMATRLGRHGVIFTDEGNIHVSNARYKKDFSPFSTLSPGLSKYTRAYLHHLIRENEMLGGTLLSLHNILYLHHMLDRRRKEIISG